VTNFQPLNPAAPSRNSPAALIGLKMAALVTAALLCLLPAGAFAAEAGAPHLDGAELGFFWVVPFVGLLLSIAVLPLVVPRFWHAHFGKVSAFWALAFLVPFAVEFGVETAVFELAHTFLLEYIPFILLLLALYTVSGGVRIAGAPRATPAVNTGILAVGTGLASFMGTTGAAMLLIRPLLIANTGRAHNVHVVVFFIFLVANIGGSLTPLGDPPLFLGFLKGVHFFWPMVHMFLPCLLTSGILLAAFYALDRHYFSKDVPPPDSPPGGLRGMRIHGVHNLVLLVAVMASVLLSGVWRPEAGITVYHVRVELQDLVRDGLFIVIVYLSLRLTSREHREANGFTWFPIVEVAKLFAGIFLTIIPALAILKAGESGALAGLVELLSHNGEPVNLLYFWITGLLSSFLDNAPTYLVFFNTAGGDPEILMGPDAVTLLAISAGAVFMGAMTYIGNAPNFMVRAIAQERGIPMPSFFGFMVWSSAILIPLFALISVVFFL